MKTHVAIGRWICLLVGFGCLLLAETSCSFLNDEDDSEAAGVCADVFHAYAPSGTTRAQCEASSRGEWFEDGTAGLCYCYGEDE